MAQRGADNSRFQFLIGNLRTHEIMIGDITLKVFQFLIGNLRTRLHDLGCIGAGLFQFLIGNLRT